MLITEILDEVDSSFKTLQTECSCFFSESGGLPLYKTLPMDYPDFRKVKVRHTKKHKDAFAVSLDMAFESERTQFSQRAIFASGSSPTPLDDTSFYIFPTNGFDFIYNTNVTNEDNKLHAFDSIYQKYGMVEGSKLIAEVLKFSYTPQHLQEGLKGGAEIILYSIPSYYALRVRSVDSYENVLSSVLI